LFVQTRFICASGGVDGALIYRFGTFTLDTELLELTSARGPVIVEPQVFTLLAYLIENRGHVVSKQELIDAVWKGRIVSDATLNSRINAARRALGDTGKSQALIRTISRRGYRFVGEAARGEARGSNDREPAGGEITGRHTLEKATGAGLRAGWAEPHLRSAAELLREIAAPVVPQDTPSVAVLPFVTDRVDQKQASFADGICDDIITSLSSISRLLVIARSSSFAYRGQEIDAKRVGRELGVAHVLEGSVRMSGTRARISAQLVNATTGAHVWADRYDRDISNAFAVQDEITQEIVTALEVKLTQGEQIRAWRRDAVSVEAYQFFARGREAYMTFTRGGMARAREELERAININPDFATALACLGFTYAEDARFQWSASRDEAIARARDAGQRALRLNPSCGIAHSVLGYVAMLERDFRQAITETARAIAIHPSGADAHQVHALVRIYDGDFAGGIRLEQRSLRLNPLALENSLVELGRAYFHTDRFNDAIAVLERASKTRPDWLTVRTLLAACYCEMGCSERAQRACAEILQLKPDFSVARWAASQLYRRADDLDRYLSSLRKASLPK
jgi:TolB-like protein/DNA-binding winged helix-turn-helix (wHTH) protein/Flp pilus assembly protein TadD